MKASGLIKELEELVEKYGDLEVERVDTNDDGYVTDTSSDVCYVTVEPHPEYDHKAPEKFIIH